MNVYHRDDPQWFRDAVDSVLIQTQKPSEVVLVVDGPVPAEMEAVIAGYESLKDFRVIRLEENRGLGNARRIGLEQCRYDLVAMMDSDDICVPRRFEWQLAAFQRDPQLDIVGGNIAEFIGTPDNIVSYRVVPQSHAQLREYTKKRCPFNHMTVMLKKASAQKAGGYQDWHFNEDYYLWIRMYLQGMKFGNIPEVLVYMRSGEDMYRRRGGWRYFKSELGLQNYMLRHGMIGPVTYVTNVLKRLILQVLLPNRLRGFVYKKFARAQSVDE